MKYSVWKIGQQIPAISSVRGVPARGRLVELTKILAGFSNQWMMELRESASVYQSLSDAYDLIVPWTSQDTERKELCCIFLLAEINPFSAQDFGCVQSSPKFINTFFKVSAMNTQHINN